MQLLQGLLLISSIHLLAAGHRPGPDFVLALDRPSKTVKAGLMLQYWYCTRIVCTHYLLGVWLGGRDCQFSKPAVVDQNSG